MNLVMSCESVRAVLSGAKTQMRIPIVPQPALHRVDNEKIPAPVESVEVVGPWAHFYGPLEKPHSRSGNRSGGMFTVCCRQGKVGSQLWIQETWCQAYARSKNHSDVKNHPGVIFLADGPDYNSPTSSDYHSWGRDRKKTWKPAVTMPRWASRLTLEITALTVERLQQVTEAGAAAEGFERREHFIRAWDEKQTQGFDANPWVWLITFQLAAT